MQTASSRRPDGAKPLLSVFLQSVFPTAFSFVKRLSSNHVVAVTFFLGCLHPAAAETAPDAKDPEPSCVTVYPIPPGEAVSDRYRLKVDGKSVPVYSCRVSAVPLNQVFPGYQRPLDQTESAGFASWDMRGSVAVEITSKQAVTEAVVRPRSLGIKPQVEGNTIRFALDSVVPITVEVNGSRHALHLFPNPEQKDVPKHESRPCTRQCTYCAPLEFEAPEFGPTNVIYFGPGVHDVGTLTLKSGDSVYLAGGAVVYGCLVAFDATDIRIFGRGILDGSRIERNDRPGVGGFGCLYFRKCRGITVEGILLRDPNFWGATFRESSEVKVSNLKMVGFWRYNADGVNVWDSSDVVVENCFVRSFDDSLVVRGGVSDMKNIRFRNCVLWCDWGVAMQFWTRNNRPESPATIDDVSFENIDVLRASVEVIGMSHIDEKISNVTYDKVNVDIEDRPMRPQFQRRTGENYRDDPHDSYCPRLIGIEIVQRPPQEARFSTITGLLFRDISVFGKAMPESRIKVRDEHKGAVSNVTIKNLRHNGELIENLQQANFSIDPQVSGVVFEP